MTIANETLVDTSIIRPVALLTGQIICLGAAAGYITVTSNTIFLDVFGSESLAVIYVLTGIAVSLLFFAIAALQRRYQFTRVAFFTIIGLGIVLLTSRWLLAIPGFAWVSGVLRILFLFEIQVALITVGSQAGRIFNVRQLKRVFPIIMAGLSVGFAIAGLSTGPVIRLFGGVADLLYPGALVLLLAAALLQMTTRLYPDRPAQLTREATIVTQPVAKPAVMSILRRRFVMLILVYQILSAFITLLAEYLYYTKTAEQFPDPVAMASFLGSFVTVMNISSVIFGAFVAGWVLDRFGLRTGVALNAAAVAAVTILIVVVTLVVGPGSVVIFWLAAATYLFDIVLTNGTTVASINNTYQALPVDERAPVQTVVEGVGVPVAFSLTGLILLGLNALPGIQFSHVAAFTAFVAGLWLVGAYFMYRDYGASLWNTLRRRSIGSGALNLADATSRRILERLLASEDLIQVRLALDALAQAEDPTLDEWLLRLLNASDTDIRVEALARIETSQVVKAVRPVERMTRPNNPLPVREAALLALFALDPERGFDAAEPLLSASHDDALRPAAIVASLKHGGLPAILAAGRLLDGAETSPDPSQRRFAAKAIGQTGNSQFYQPLLNLLRDDDISVRATATWAAGQVAHPRLIAPLVENLRLVPLRSATLNALTAMRDHLLPLLTHALDSELGYSPEMVARLVRAATLTEQPALLDLLKRYIGHSDDIVQMQVLSALQRLGYTTHADDESDIHHTLMQMAERGLNHLVALQMLPDDVDTSRLRDAIHDEHAALLDRLLVLLTFSYDPGALRRIGLLLRSDDQAGQAMAVETMEMTLSSTEIGVVLPLINADAPLQQRIARLRAHVSHASYPEVQSLLIALVANAQYHMSGWTRAVAIHYAATQHPAGILPVLPQLLADDEAVVRQTALWALHRLDEYAAAAHLQVALSDPHRQVHIYAQFLQAS